MADMFPPQQTLVDTWESHSKSVIIPVRQCLFQWLHREPFYLHHSTRRSVEEIRLDTLPQDEETKLPGVLPSYTSKNVIISDQFTQEWDLGGCACMWQEWGSSFWKKARYLWAVLWLTEVTGAVLVHGGGGNGADADRGRERFVHPEGTKIISSVWI